jgi:hypothetical protein
MAESREELCLKLARLWRSALWLWARADFVSSRFSYKNLGYDLKQWLANDGLR